MKKYRNFFIKLMIYVRFTKLSFLFENKFKKKFAYIFILIIIFFIIY